MKQGTANRITALVRGVQPCNHDCVPDLLTVEVLAAKWHLKPGTVRTWARRGTIPSRKMGRLIVFDAHELAEWYQQLPSAAKPEQQRG